MERLNSKHLLINIIYRSLFKNLSYYLLIHERRVPCCRPGGGTRNNPEGLIFVSGRVSRVPRQSERRSVQIVFNRPTDDGGAVRRGGYEIPR